MYSVLDIFLVFFLCFGQLLNGYLTQQESFWMEKFKVSKCAILCATDSVIFKQAAQKCSYVDDGDTLDWRIFN